MTQPILMVATTDIDDMMAPAPGRRMDLPGFADEFVDFPHYIIHITEKIWHDREVERCLDWYARDCVIHTLAGPVTGAQAVVDNTWATLAAFPDRRLDADNVIWSDEGNGSFLSSHLITSKMTNLGPSDFGPATGKAVLVRTIADCLCRENRIVEEWLVRDNLALVLQLGLSPQDIAARQAGRDLAAGRPLPDILAPYRASVASAQDAAPVSEASAVAVDLLKARWREPDAGLVRALCDFRLNAWYPGGVFLYGPDQIATWQGSVATTLSGVQMCIEHVAEVRYLGDARDVAIRWSLTGTHASGGRYGPATGAPLMIMAVSHFRVIAGRVREEVTIWDDLAVLRQASGARLK